MPRHLLCILLEYQLQIQAKSKFVNETSSKYGIDFTLNQTLVDISQNCPRRESQRATSSRYLCTSDPVQTCFRFMEISLAESNEVFPLRAQKSPLIYHNFIRVGLPDPTSARGAGWAGEDDRRNVKCR